MKKSTVRKIIIGLVVLTIIIFAGIFINYIKEQREQMENYRAEVEKKRQSIEKSLDKMIFVKGGTFQMGSNKRESDEKPVHTVTVNDFYIGKYEVTHKEYIEFLNSKGVSPNGSFGGKEYIDMNGEDCAVDYKKGFWFLVSGKFYFKGNKYADQENCPIIEVTWYGAKAYCEWKGGRLPTEAEWEYAARGGNKRQSASLSPLATLRTGLVEDYKYSGSNNLGDVAWYNINSGMKTHKVGTKQANELGIYDMSGNVWEWCNDWYSYINYYKSSPMNNPKGPDSGSNRVLRGGCWLRGPSRSRVAFRGGLNPDDCYYSVGFRLVKCKLEE
ncbi:MAG: formylglycine-generating enzyme family protein [Candidatus Cloacimonetes bacterium]|nr:formylglycine-generating enzyme family protein [Candidatus Cloacimonadota bacterium]